MKRYKLLRDLPYAEAGEIFYAKARIRKAIAEPLLINSEREEVQLWAKDIKNFNKCFEEIEEPELPKEFFFVFTNKIDSVNYLNYSFDEETMKEYRNIVEKYKSVGNCFETREEAEKYLEYLKAKVIIKQDTNGYKPNWNDIDKTKYHGQWDYKYDCPYCAVDWTLRDDTICFETREEAEESFKKHPEEWKTYLTYEQQ